jgi:hypothetical protein
MINPKGVKATDPQSMLITQQPRIKTMPKKTGNNLFEITFQPRLPGKVFATVTIPNNDEAKSPFIFDIVGTGKYYNTILLL